jgi:hypothetical protein
VLVEGFSLGAGRRGRGVYFWRKSRKWMELARGWYRRKYSEGEYEGDPNPLGVVILAVARVPENGYLDLSDQDAKDGIDEIADRIGIDKNDQRQIAATYERFIEEVEREIGNRIEIFEVEVAPPGPDFCPDYSIQLSGAPRCYVVRNPRAIHITGTEEFT